MRKICKTQLLVFFVVVHCTGGDPTTGNTPVTCWTRWFDRNNPNEMGESELLSDLRQALPELICANPVGIVAETTGGLTAENVKNVIHLNASVGLLCLNQEQKGTLCKDYTVKFLCSGAFCTGCQTAWLNADTTRENNGDFELLSLLRSAFPLQTCANPIAIQVETANGQLPYTSTGDVIKACDASNGFACLNDDQQGKFCHDYRVRLTCSPDFCTAPTECRSIWFNSDSPKKNDYGDNETVAHVKNVYQDRMCDSPTGIEVSTWSGLKASLSPDVFKEYNISKGFLCLDEDQKQQECKDYFVKFICPAQFCTGCRTPWFNRDDSTKNGDYETLHELMLEYQGQICPDPISIEAQTVDGIPASQTGQIFDVYDATLGFACINKKQKTGSPCLNYKVRFTCPAHFCAGQQVKQHLFQQKILK